MQSDEAAFIFAVVFVVALVIAFIAVGIKKASEAMTEPEYMNNAKVLLMSSSRHEYSPTLIIYSITFEKQNGDRICLSATKDVYNTLIKGDSVNVTYRAGKILSVTRNK